jgi:hypothetical protein
MKGEYLMLFHDVDCGCLDRSILYLVYRSCFLIVVTLIGSSVYVFGVHLYPYPSQGQPLCLSLGQAKRPVSSAPVVEPANSEDKQDRLRNVLLGW